MAEKLKRILAFAFGFCAMLFIVHIAVFRERVHFNMSAFNFTRKREDYKEFYDSPRHVPSQGSRASQRITASLNEEALKNFDITTTDRHREIAEKLFQQAKQFNFPLRDVDQLLKWREKIHTETKRDIESGRLKIAPSSIMLVAAYNGINKWKIPEVDERNYFNRRLYAFLHGYTTHFQDINSLKNVHASKTVEGAQRSKAKVLRAALSEHPEAQWLWWFDFDGIIMNLEVGLEEYLLGEEAMGRKALLDHKYIPFEKKIPDPLNSFSVLNYEDIHFIISEDFNMINSGSVFFKRGIILDVFLDLWDDPFLNSRQVGIGWQDQGLMAFLLLNHEIFTKATITVPQIEINAYSGNEPWSWKPGNLAIHFAGSPDRGREPYFKYSSKLARLAEDTWLKDVDHWNQSQAGHITDSTNFT